MKRGHSNKEIWFEADALLQIPPLSGQHRRANIMPYTSSNTATTTNETSNVTSLPNAPKPQTSKEVIAANVKLLIDQLEAGLTAYLTAMGRFHRYSFSNVLEIARQMPSASRVAGMYAWNQLGRKVKKGSKGIRILAPVVGIRRKKDSEAEKNTPFQNEPVLVG